MGRGGRLDAPGAEHADSRRRTGTRDGGRPLERRGQGRPLIDRPTEEVGDPATDGAPVSRATLGVSLGREAVRPNKIDPSSPDSRVCESHQACCPAHQCRFFFCPDVIGPRRRTSGALCASALRMARPNQGGLPPVRRVPRCGMITCQDGPRCAFPTGATCLRPDWRATGDPVDWPRRAGGKRCPSAPTRCDVVCFGTGRVGSDGSGRDARKGRTEPRSREPWDR